jgi:GT2 family glycosyltransferase
MNTANTISIIAPPGLISIIMPCCGMREYTELGIPNLLRVTREPFELIFVDIGSLDGTAEYLRGIRDGQQARRVEICRAQTDLDIPTACREALDRARGEFVCLLNNDTIVVPGWLEALTGLAKLSEAHGLVGPMSNYAAPPQFVETVPYRLGPKKDGELIDVSAVQTFAREFAKQYHGKWMQVNELGGFCLLIRRAVLDRIGLALYEHTDLGLFNTNIVSAKAREAGFNAVCCRDLFIHHFGTRTFAHGAPEPGRESVNGARRS